MKLQNKLTDQLVTHHPFYSNTITDRTFTIACVPTRRHDKGWWSSAAASGPPSAAVDYCYCKQLRTMVLIIKHNMYSNLFFTNPHCD